MIDFDSLPKKSCYNCYWYDPDSTLQCGLLSVRCASSPDTGDMSKPMFTDLVNGLNLMIQREETARLIVDYDRQEEMTNREGIPMR